MSYEKGIISGCFNTSNFDLKIKLLPKDLNTAFNIVMHNLLYGDESVLGMAVRSGSAIILYLTKFDICYPFPNQCFLEYYRIVIFNFYFFLYLNWWKLLLIKNDTHPDNLLGNATPCWNSAGMLNCFQLHLFKVKGKMISLSSISSDITGFLFACFIFVFAIPHLLFYCVYFAFSKILKSTEHLRNTRKNDTHMEILLDIEYFVQKVNIVKTKKNKLIFALG